MGLLLWRRGTEDLRNTVPLGKKNFQGGKESDLVHLSGKWMDEEVVSK